MQAPNTKDQKRNFPKSFYILLIFALFMPIAVPVTSCLMQAWLWTVVLSKISGVFFSFGFVEATLFVAALSSFAFLTSAIYGLGRFLKSGKPFKQYLADSKSQRQKQLASLKEKGVKFDASTAKDMVQVYVVYLFSNIAALMLSAHFFPGKIGFEQPQLILYCALISTALRALYWQWLYLLSQYGNDYIETIKARYPLEDRTI